MSIVMTAQRVEIRFAGRISVYDWAELCSLCSCMVCTISLPSIKACVSRLPASSFQLPHATRRILYVHLKMQNNHGACAERGAGWLHQRVRVSKARVRSDLAMEQRSARPMAMDGPWMRRGGGQWTRARHQAVASSRRRSPIWLIDWASGTGHRAAARAPVCSERASA